MSFRVSFIEQNIVFPAELGNEDFTEGGFATTEEVEYDRVAYPRSTSIKPQRRVLRVTFTCIFQKEIIWHSLCLVRGPMPLRRASNSGGSLVWQCTNRCVQIVVRTISAYPSFLTGFTEELDIWVSSVRMRFAEVDIMRRR
jgi:hypothetical protein